VTDLAAPNNPKVPADLSKREVVIAEARDVARRLWSTASYFETTAYDLGVAGGGCLPGLELGMDKDSCARRKEQLALIREARDTRNAAKDLVNWALELDQAVPDASGADIEESDVLRRHREMMAKASAESAA